MRRREIGNRKLEAGNRNIFRSSVGIWFPFPLCNFRFLSSLKREVLLPLGLMLSMLSFSACGPSGSQINAIDLENRFISALYAGNLSAVDSCLADGVNVNIRDVNEIPAIMIAANSGNIEVVKRLIEGGADVNARSPQFYNSTALMEIAANEDVKMAAYLIEQGANVHLRDSFGDPAMNWAAYYGDIPFIDLLVKNGASWDVKSQNGTAIDVAMKQWNDPLLDYFIEKGAGVPLEGDALALAKAVREGDLQTLAALLNQGASAMQVDELGTPILVNAASKGDVEMLRLLIARGADANGMNRVGQTALARASYFGHTNLVKELLSNRVDVNLTDDFYQITPLIGAAAGGNPIIGQLLIDQGADIDHQEGISGFTSLMMATAYRNEEFIKVLLDAGANPYIKTMDGMSLSDMVSYSNNPRIAEMIQEYLMKH